MDKQNSIYAFFVLLALLFWNPLTFYALYHSTAAYESGLIHGVNWVLFVGGIAVFYLTRKGTLPKRLMDLSLYFNFFTLLFSLLVLVNYAMTPAKTPEKQGIIFEPNSKARYQSVEFDFMANANSLGLRDREIALDKGDKYRILCFGDSWTFGWGVDISASWPSKLEAFLHAQGLTNVEVINCGQGGQYTTIYLDYMNKAVPLLKPDMVIVGVLQGDDLAQLYEEHFDNSHMKPTNHLNFFQQLFADTKMYLLSSVGNVTLPFRNQYTNELEIKSYWKQSSNYKISQFNHLQYIRFRALNDSIQSLCKSGDLNPGLLSYYVDFADRQVIFNNPANPATQFAAKVMDSEIKQMKSLCEKHQSVLVFANMPINFYNGHQVIRTPSDVLNPFLEQNNRIDSIYRSIAENNGLPYIEMTQHFRSLADKEAYHFIYDGHPNEKGYAEIAQFVGQKLMAGGLIQKP